jgi:hypothetical protein
MSTGYAVTKTDLDNRMGALVLNVRQALAACVAFKVLLDDATILPDATLTTLGYSGAEITMIRAAFTDLKKLSDISSAAATQASTNDFWFNAKHLTGIAT